LKASSRKPGIGARYCSSGTFAARKEQASSSKVPQAAAKLCQRHSLLWRLPWGHDDLLMAKVKPLDVRVWYTTQSLVRGWRRNTLSLKIHSQAHARQGQVVSNFATRLPAPQSDLAQQRFT
jgi:hypothetical protein